MDTLQILERYYNAFIEQEATKPFFLGLTDYLDYAETLPEYDLITTLISNQAKPLSEKLAAQDKIAKEKVVKVHKEIEKYIEKNGIQNEFIAQQFREYNAFLEGHAHSSRGLTEAIHDCLHEIIEFLYNREENRSFATKYIEFLESNKTMVRRYLPLKELDDFAESKAEWQRGYRDALWGAQAHIYELYDVIRKGRERHKAMVERHRKRESKATYDLLNYSLIFGEWNAIEEGKSDRIPTFFNVKKIKPLVQRFHMYVLAHFSDARKTLEEVGKKADHTHFDPDSSRLYVQSQDFRIRRVSDQYDALRVIFADSTETNKEWFFDEIAEKVDSDHPEERVKKYYNAVYQLNRKLAEKGVQDFFITTAHSARINKKYLS